MNKTKKAKQSKTSTEITPNKQVEQPKGPSTLTEYYSHWYDVLFNKLSKDEQDALTANLGKGQQLIRGVPREFANVRDFARAVVEKAEIEYDRAQAKIKAEAEETKST